MAKKKPVEMGNISKVLPCKCPNRTQDKKYGKGQRLHYKCAGGWRCNTCKAVKHPPKKAKVEA